MSLQDLLSSPASSVLCHFKTFPVVMAACCRQNPILLHNLLPSCYSSLLQDSPVSLLDLFPICYGSVLQAYSYITVVSTSSLVMAASCRHKPMSLPDILPSYDSILQAQSYVTAGPPLQLLWQRPAGCVSISYAGHSWGAGVLHIMHQSVALLLPTHEICS